MDDETAIALSGELVKSAAISYFDDSSVEIDGWTATASDVGFGQGDVFFVEIDASIRGTNRPISLVCKRLPYNEEHLDSHSLWYWRREAEVYGDLLAGNRDLPGGITAPSCYKIAEGDEQIWLVLEHVQGANLQDFSYDELLESARRIGHFNGYYAAHTDEAAKFGHWTSRDWIKNWGNRSNIDEAWTRYREDFDASEYVRKASPQEVVKTRLDLARAARDLPDRYDTLPKTLCHLDVFHKNMLRGQSNQLVLIDWAFTGIEIIGADLSCLVNFALLVPSSGTAGKEGQFERDILDAYIAGVQDAGYDCDSDLVRFGYYAATTVRWGGMILGKWPYESATWPKVKAWCGVETREEHADLVRRWHDYMISVMKNALQFSKRLNNSNGAH